MKIYSTSLGCPKNRVDTETALGFAARAKYTSAPEKADLVFINTCGFIAPAVEESVRTIMDAIASIQDLPAEKRPLLVVAGCLVGRYGKEVLAPDLPEVDLLLPNSEFPTWREQIIALCMKKGRIKRPPAAWPRSLSTGPSYAWLKINEGCRHNCSFCTIPAIRGKLSSAPLATLVNEARFLLAQGVKELVLVGQDVTDWGKEKGENLIPLLEGLLPLKGLVWLRLMYLYPAGLTTGLLSFLRDAGPPFVPYFDIPLQHAAPGVLSRMGRPFATNPYAVVERVRQFFPQAALRTSIITGFPGETEKDFAALLKFVEDIRFHHLGVFAYEAEEGTPAASMPGQVPAKLRLERKERIMQAQSLISQEILDAYTGSVQTVLVDGVHEEWPGLHTGRTWFQAPESDGITYISGPKVQPGNMVQAEVTDTATYDLSALALEDEK